MLASDLIRQLQEMKQIYGDREVRPFGPNRDYDVANVDISEDDLDAEGDDSNTTYVAPFLLNLREV